ncbi:MAG: hypothetical protein Fur0044_47740 [Anaerolineae bacterium]
MSASSLIHQLGQHWPGWFSGLKQVAQQRALRRAIAHNYPSFAATYPEWTDYLFDNYFLNQRAFPVLARYLNYKVVPTPFELAQVWAEQLTWSNLEMKERHVAQLMPVATDFLRRLNKDLFNRHR